LLDYIGKHTINSQDEGRKDARCGAQRREEGTEEREEEEGEREEHSNPSALT